MTKLSSEAAIRAGDDWSDEIRAELLANRRNGRVGQHLLSETSEVRVWSVSLKPGERVGFHRHVLNYFWVAVTAGTSLSHYATGESRETVYHAGMTRHFQFGKGEFMLHDLVNIGESELVFTTVEFKNSPNPTLPIEIVP